MSFKKSGIESLNFNPFSLIGNEWLLITAGDKNKFNTMTASWGGVGVLWKKNVSFIFVRPQRYTFEFLERESNYTLSFFNKKYKPALGICGGMSGRDTNKIEKSGLTPDLSYEVPFFKEASKVLICKKLYSQFISPDCFHENELISNYKDNDYHKMFVGEITELLVNSENE